MAFEPKDDVIYDELWNVTPALAVTKGDAAVVQDVFGFYFFSSDPNDVELDAAETTFIYRMRQVLADKATGTGEAILAGDRLYYIVANDNVSPTPVGVAGTNYYFCGWAKKDATAAATTVLMNFDGTRYDEAV